MWWVDFERPMSECPLPCTTFHDLLNRILKIILTIWISQLWYLCAYGHSSVLSLFDPFIRFDYSVPCYLMLWNTRFNLFFECAIACCKLELKCNIFERILYFQFHISTCFQFRISPFYWKVKYHSEQSWCEPTSPLMLCSYRKLDHICDTSKRKTWVISKT